MKTCRHSMVTRGYASVLTVTRLCMPFSLLYYFSYIYIFFYTYILIPDFFPNYYIIPYPGTLSNWHHWMCISFILSIFPRCSVLLLIFVQCVFFTPTFTCSWYNPATPLDLIRLVQIIQRRVYCGTTGVTRWSNFSPFFTHIYAEFM